MYDQYEKLKSYVTCFNQNDEECYKQLIPNEKAEAFLAEQIPLLDCPDKTIEEIYYFRWWTFRKHMKETEKGHIITEFLPPVRWAGPYNSINCPACFHIREGRWLKDEAGWLKEYIDFWLEGHGDLYKYSAWIAHAVWEYCELKNDFAYGVERLPLMVKFFETREATHKRSSGLYWSNDNRDGMEYSISGPGLRTTINSYVYADAYAISRFAALAGDSALQERFEAIADGIKAKMDTLLWDGDFYKTIPQTQEQDEPFTARPAVVPEHDAREQVGFVPWYFGIPDAGKEQGFAELLKEDGFLAPAGLTTAERRHPRYMEAFTHECLWNGPVWPFATSQTLVACANLLRGYDQNVLTKADYFQLLRQYALSHHMTLPDGRVVPWIDENMHPESGIWLARDHLEKAGWLERKGGYERGKDYNHSLYCDLVLSGLLGIGVENGAFTVKPLIPDSWTYFRVENLWLEGKKYTITYDKDGSRYGMGAGIRIQ